MINKFLIINFQKHSQLELNFAQDRNVIIGPTRSGKSVIFKALEWVCGLSNISENDFRKEGTKETSVKIWLINNYQVERIKSNTINRYVLSKAGCDDKVFDSFGKFIPEEIADVLNIPSITIDNERINLNFANQDQLNFLIDGQYSDTFKAKLFNKLTGNEILDKLFKELNKDHLKCIREIPATEELIAKQEEQITEYSLSYKMLKNKLCMVTDKFKKIKEEVEKYEHLKDLSDKLKINKENEEFIKFKKSQIKIISDEKLKQLKTDAEELQKLQELSNKIKIVNESIEQIKKQKEQIKVVDVDFDKLKKDNELIQKLKRLNEQLVRNIEKEQDIVIEKKEINEKLKIGEEELEKIWKKQRCCPLCKQEIDYEKIL